MQIPPPDDSLDSYLQDRQSHVFQCRSYEQTEINENYLREGVDNI